MTSHITLSDAGEIIDPPLHDAKVKGLLLTSNGGLLIPVGAGDGVNKCLVLRGVERLRSDDFREGNIILDVTVSSDAFIEAEDVAYVYGLEPRDRDFLQQTTERLKREKLLLVKLNPSYGCTLVCVCQEIDVEDDLLFRK